MDTWSYTRRVHYYETDRMGVVHHSNYLRLVEEARLAWVEQNVMSYADIEKNGVVIPAISACGHFKNFLHYNDLFSVHVTLTKFNGVRFSFEYVIYNEEGTLIYEGTSEHCFVTYDGYHPISLKRKYPELYNKFAEQLNVSNT